MTLIRKTMTPLLRGYLFAPNAPFMWRAMHRELQPYFDDWRTENSIYAYLLLTDRDAWMSGGELMGAVLNTGLEMDQGIQKARALIQPTRAARYIDMVIGATRTGESFATYEQLKDLPFWVKK
jgi:enoyl-CoA hydratase/carnithine racemase